MGCIALVRCVLVLRCGLAGVVWYPYAGCSLHTDTTPPQQASACIRIPPHPSQTAGSIPAGVIGFFINIKSFRSHHGPGVDSACNRNEYQEYFLGVKAAGALG